MQAKRLKVLGWPLDAIMAMPDPQQLKNRWWGQKLTPPSIASRPRAIKPSKSISNIWTTIGLPVAAHASAENIQEGFKALLHCGPRDLPVVSSCLLRQSSTLAAPLTLRLNTPRRTQAHVGRQIRRPSHNSNNQASFKAQAGCYCQGSRSCVTHLKAWLIFASSL